MRVRTTTKFKDLKGKKLRKLGEEFDCNKERYEEIKAYVKPIAEDDDSAQEEPEQAEESAQEEKPKKAAKAKKGNK